jgi:hypothetical protein
MQFDQTVPRWRAPDDRLVSGDLEFETTAWLGMSDSNWRIRPRVTCLELRDNFA